eukprot:CAMPEP_0196774308 /NCGR_PEP_ID=MMETSP1104-20130614/3315_1 /TAXON_ID=33652 /ORGANISM="Cafeteria sp., Strain Caron Lab Isolate" /LENGTH=52 /DNA_ID=CAMNT_0042144463 /DNA_START=200 /DNA_END=355 /DNA_ORIENTATION=+
MQIFLVHDQVAEQMFPATRLAVPIADMSRIKFCGPNIEAIMPPMFAGGPWRR